jgi:SPX domain protein involved in polyphosphate accumulation
MRFIEKLSHNSVVEWAPYYLDYGALKDVLLGTDNDPPSKRVMNVLRRFSSLVTRMESFHDTPEVIVTNDEANETCVPDASSLAQAIMRRNSNSLLTESEQDLQFRSMLLKEIRKVDGFYARTLLLLEEQYRTLKSQVHPSPRFHRFVTTVKFPVFFISGGRNRGFETPRG